MAVMIFSIGHSRDMFLVLRAQEAGIAAPSLNAGVDRFAEYWAANASTTGQRPGPVSDLRTQAEVSKFTEYTSYDNMMKYLQDRAMEIHQAAGAVLAGDRGAQQRVDLLRRDARDRRRLLLRAIRWLVRAGDDGRCLQRERGRPCRR